MKQYHLVYIIVNLINLKTYLGVHSTTDINDSYMGSGKIIKKAIEKYGVENFKKFILHECSSREEALQIEKYYINEEVVLSKETYNLSLGGYSYPTLPGQLNPASKTNMSEEKRKEKGKRGYQTRINNGTVRKGDKHNFSKAFLGEEALRIKALKSVDTRRNSGVLKEVWNKMQEAKADKANEYILISPDGTVYEIKYNLLDFCRKHKLSYACLYDRIHTNNYGYIKGKVNKASNENYINTIGWGIFKKDEYEN